VIHRLLEQPITAIDEADRPNPAIGLVNRSDRVIE
jgi:hypothetical protein